MSDLYKNIDAANKFKAPPIEGVPVKDQSEQAAVGLDWAARNQAQKPPEAEVPQMKPIIPVAN